MIPHIESARCRAWHTGGASDQWPETTPGLRWLAVWPWAHPGSSPVRQELLCRPRGLIRGSLLQSRVESTLLTCCSPSTPRPSCFLPPGMARRTWACPSTVNTSNSHSTQASPQDHHYSGGTPSTPALPGLPLRSPIILNRPPCSIL